MRAVAAALILVFPLALAASEVQLGNSIEEVRAALGMPKGQVRVGARQLLYFDRGEVELQSGSVSRINLLSVEAQAALAIRRAAQTARIREEQEILRVRLTAEGEALLARKLADRSFQSAPVAYQVAFWEDFARRYPGVPVTDQLMVARSRLAELREQLRIQTEQAERLADLEARVREAEARASEAETYPLRTGYYSSYAGGRSGGRQSYSAWPVAFPAVFPRPCTPAAIRSPYAHMADQHGRESRAPDTCTDFNRRDPSTRDHYNVGVSRLIVARNHL